MGLKLPKRLAVTTGAAYNRAPKQEKELAKRLGARTTKASGSKGEKGDVRMNGLYRIECKATQQKSYSLTRETFYKIAAAGASANEIAAIIVEFLNERGAVEAELAVIRVEDLMKMFELLAEKANE